VFALVAVAPWAKTSALAQWYILPRDWLTPLDKQHLSLLKVLDVLALAYLAAYFVPASARWLDSAGACFFRALGRASLSVFAVSAILGVVGWIIWHAGGRSIACQFTLIVIGVAVMWVTAHLVEARAALVSALRDAIVPIGWRLRRSAVPSHELAS
jgi:hypothetical protein